MTSPPPSRPDTGPDTRMVAAFVIVALVWGSTWLVIKDQIGAMAAGWTIALRFVLGALGCIVLAGVRGESLWLDWRAQRIALAMGVLQFCANFQFVYRAEAFITSGIVAVLYALLMVPNALLARLFLGQGVSGRFLTGSAIAIAGIAVLLVHELRLAPTGDRVGLGIALALGGLLCASLANVLQGTRAVDGIAAIPLLAWGMVWGALIDGGLAYAMHGPPVFPAEPRFWAGALYLGLVGSVLTFPLYFALIRGWGAGRAAYNGVAVPIIAMLLSTRFDGYRWSLLAALGAALAMAGLLVALSGGRVSTPLPPE